MANQQVKNFYNQFTNPSGKAPMPTTLGGFFGNAPTSLKDLFSGLKAPAPQANAPTPAVSGAMEGPIRPKPVASSAPIFSAPKSYAAPTPAAATPAPVQTPSSETTPVPSQWVKPDGSFYTPDEIADNIATQLKATAGGEDIGNYAVDQFTGGEKTEEQLKNEARQLGNAKGDMASGEEDPWGIASKSGIAYTPEELRAIENASAGIYDPALTTAYSKLEAKQSADAEAAKWERELEKLEVQHGYDLEKMKMDNDFQYALAGYKAALDKSNGGGSGSGGNQSDYVDEQQFRSVQQANQLLQMAEGNEGIFGRTAALPVPDFLRSDEFRNYASAMDTLKNSIAVGELQAMRADSSTGGALGQVSDQESARLSAALGALNMNQTPDQIKSNLRQVITSINRYRAVKGEAPIPTGTGGAGSQPPTMVLNGQTLQLQPDGTYE